MLPDNILFSADPTNDLLAFLNKKNYSQCVVLVDEHTQQHCYPLIQHAVGEHFVIEVKSGEEQKNLNTCIHIWQKMTDRALDRHAVMLVLGGGVLGDMGGFCASTYKRGIDFVLIPTTLLAQADASIGGKLGIDFNHFKNHIGVFNLPALTLLHSGFLKTLPEGELRSGFAEVLKHALISDEKMFRDISNKSLHEQDWDTLLKHSVTFKANVTTEDPTEKGLRKILNAGHTIGHAVESYMLAGGQRILHGEAIAIGIIAEGFVARERLLLTDADFRLISDFILKIYGKVMLSDQQIIEAAQLTMQDKKNKGNEILTVLQRGIGNAGWDYVITIEEVKRALTFYQSL